ncbi:hypothetical protein F4778DRAFT_515733 [Xylariomycetidae sp. FL2044]|nr:hypothetical protein F4778DRAFT_515733 [Xylariomycetidae sp. FL2044]
MRHPIETMLVAMMMMMMMYWMIYWAFSRYYNERYMYSISVVPATSLLTFEGALRLHLQVLVKRVCWQEARRRYRCVSSERNLGSKDEVEVEYRDEQLMSHSGNNNQSWRSRMAKVDERRRRSSISRSNVSQDPEVSSQIEAPLSRMIDGVSRIYTSMYEVDARMSPPIRTRCYIPRRYSTVQ